jgi:hypothetical protein
VPGNIIVPMVKSSNSLKKVFPNINIADLINGIFSSVMFLDALEQLYRWRRECLPGAETPQGAELLVWLLKAHRTRVPLKDLYRSSRFSEPTVRTRLNAFIAEGLAVIELDGNDARRHLVRTTAKLDKIAAEYIQRIDEVAQASLEDGGRPDPDV